VVDRIAERLVDMALNLRVEGDHLADGHGNLLRRLKLWIGAELRLCQRLAERRFLFCSAGG
jgi:hypothetical protein